MIKPKYSILTESSGMKASKEQVERIYQRYRFASKYCNNKKILEVACGSGIGLEYLAKKSDFITGVDIDIDNIQQAKKTISSSEYSNRIKISQMDAHILEFEDNSFDVIILFEAIYYFKNPENFIKESKRVLKSDGILIIASVNKDWDSFHASPFTYKYFSVKEYYTLLKNGFNNITFYGGFHTGKDSGLFSLIKKSANKLNLIPGNLKARAYLKRIFIGKLIDLPESITDNYEYSEPEIIEQIKENKSYKIIYVTANSIK